ncbi:CPLD51 protein required for cyt b6 assembly [Ectocarpus siliculosus]|uniref:CPLD51 protein required for cyt b6 assembly n=1 Tax=Ectocarpus siliculosus TaxID=2880 RepID=D8LHH2_ECTSI|nr:CPLD51 protein required for cyt b6 assembly [Ectocarpus siliculosus]|eukprot:CBN79123.1 CPLD51 protein required for cyt b6 assembly [Ectocarpus siliculosus]
MTRRTTRSALLALSTVSLAASGQGFFAGTTGTPAFVATSGSRFFSVNGGRPVSSRRARAAYQRHWPSTAGSPLSMVVAPHEVVDAAVAAHHAVSALPSFLLSDEAVAEAAGSVGYSKFSYYTTLGLYVLSFPGLWSVVKRATKTKYKDATYELPGPASTEKGAESVKQTAAKIIAYFQANNYKIKEAGETITFEGAIQASKGQAFFLVFCTALSFATLALVLQIQFPAIGNYWFLLTLLSPYAGVYYWQNGSRNDKAQVRLETSDDDTLTEIYITGAAEELDRLSKTMGYMEKGMIRVKGLLEGEAPAAPVVPAVPAPAAPVEEPAETEA